MDDFPLHLGKNLSIIIIALTNASIPVISYFISLYEPEDVLPTDFKEFENLFSELFKRSDTELVLVQLQKSGIDWPSVASLQGQHFLHLSLVIDSKRVVQ